MCESDLRCAAATTLSAPPSYRCRLFKFGFEKVLESSDSIAFIKPEVTTELSNMDKLSKKFPAIHAQKRLYGFYNSFDALTPTRCFNECKQSLRCGAATFTTDTRPQFNCYLCRPGQFTEGNATTEREDGAEYWTILIYLRLFAAIHSLLCP
jgi:hypothetical protein